jgi:hypothetical protein
VRELNVVEDDKTVRKMGFVEEAGERSEIGLIGREDHYATILLRQMARTTLNTMILPKQVAEPVSH